MRFVCACVFSAVSLSLRVNSISIQSLRTLLRLDRAEQRVYYAFSNVHASRDPKENEKWQEILLNREETMKRRHNSNGVKNASHYTTQPKKTTASKYITAKQVDFKLCSTRAE